MEPNEIIGQFEIFKNKAQESLCDWLIRELPILRTNCWQSCVLNKLKDEQLRFIRENNVNTISGLDFAQLLKILDGNWYDLRQKHNFSQEQRNYLSELQTARNRWSHKTTDKIRQNPNGINYDDLYRDIDTIWRFMGLFDTTSHETLEEIQQFKMAIRNPPSPSPSPSPSPPQPPPFPPRPRPEPDDLIQKEIRKVKNRVPRWARNQYQINARILTLFLQLEGAGSNNITQQMLIERYGNESEFNRNFQQMKEIAPKNHGKVFDVIDGVVKIWQPVQDVVNEYKRNVFQQI